MIDKMLLNVVEQSRAWHDVCIWGLYRVPLMIKNRIIHYSINLPKIWEK